MDKGRHPHVIRTWTVERTKTHYRPPQAMKPRLAPARLSGDHQSNRRTAWVRRPRTITNPLRDGGIAGGSNDYGIATASRDGHSSRGANLYSDSHGVSSPAGNNGTGV